MFTLCIAYTLLPYPFLLKDLGSGRLQAFHGQRTKRITDITNNSQTFRDVLIDNDFVHDICKRCFSEQGMAGDYWLSTSQTINVGGHQKAQILHRDLGCKSPKTHLEKNCLDGLSQHLTREIRKLIQCITGLALKAPRLRSTSSLLPQISQRPMAQRASYLAATSGPSIKEARSSRLSRRR